MRNNQLTILICALSLLAIAQTACAADPPSPGPMQSGSGSKPAASAFDVNKLFANTCGWCHLSGGRAPGKGPQLMGTALTDAEITSRIKNGKVGQMPAFATAFDDTQIKAIIGYIRELKPEN
jgi:mono/diheme cytochrome c family protein